MYDVDDGTQDRIILRSYKDQLKYNSSDLKVVLFSKGQAYEYSQDTHRFRPFNSVLWYPLNDLFDDFIFYLDNKIFEIEDQFYNDKNWKSVFFSSIIRDGRIEINLDYINTEIVVDARLDIKKSFNSFFEFLSKIYDSNETILKTVINNQKDIL